MSRHLRNKKNEIDIAKVAPELSVLKSSPLAPIVDKLEQGLTFLKAALTSGSCSRTHFDFVLSQTNAVVQALPKQFGSRFWFDAQMIHAIKENWNGDVQRLSYYLIPVNRDEWGHQGVFVPVGDQLERRISINLIQFPGGSELNDISLLDYPFLCHELAHNLYFFNDSFFRKSFSEKLRVAVAKLRLQAISDQGTAKTMSERIRRQIQTYWQPTDNHKNWAHEIAMDLAGVWTCGPAYVAALLYELDTDQKNPFLLTQEHPPYAVRVDALILACIELGWEQEAVELRRVSSKWRKSAQARQISNQYVAAADSDLIAQCVDCALAACQHHSLPKCDRETLARIKHLISQNETPDWGTDLILAAHLKYELDKANYERWEQTAIRNLVDSLTQ